jgi:diaminohydroxyphosphoribosylaminopyrimidine deaminase / 5-amino-6-(5-phosphoribosylamino)uracil reductase
MSASTFLQQALNAAFISRGQCAPNPAVGAIVLDSNNEILATGEHQGPGFPHAEIDALQKLSFQAVGLTMVVTLEPCCHQGRTPPCTEALIKSGIKRVIYGYEDPNPLVAGKGAAALKKAGIICEFISLPAINHFYASYAYWHQTKTPFITAKIAMSLDGKIAGKEGKPIQITGEKLSEYTHYHRKISDAILTTATTIKNDNPKLNARYLNKVIPKNLYILDTQLSLPLDAIIFQTAKNLTIFHAPAAPVSNQLALKKLGARCLPIKENIKGLDLEQVIKCIGNDGVHDLWIEAGGKCFRSFIEKNLIQRALIYVAPHWIGEGIAAFDDMQTVKNNFFNTLTWKQMGNDCVLEIIF